MAANKLFKSKALCILLILAATSRAIHGAEEIDWPIYRLVRSSTPQLSPLIGNGNAVLKVSALRGCINKCSRLPNACYSFIYNEDEQSCHLGSWSIASGKIFGQPCTRLRDFSKYEPQIPIRPAGKLYTKACCSGDFVLRTLSASQPKCLFFSKNPLTFSAARTDCERRSSRMVTFKTKDELTFVQELLHCMDTTWVGLQDNCHLSGVDCKNDTSARKFFWPDNSELCGVVKDVVTQKLDNIRGKEGCLQLGGTFHQIFNDAPCENEKFHYICEKNPSPTDPKEREALYC